jgi:hypothetical protein
LDLREAVALDTPRRLLALIRGLPPDAATFRDEQPSWTQRDELLATLVEVTDAWGRQVVATLVALHGGKVRLPEPVRVRHPERAEAEPPEKHITTDAAEIAAFFKTRVA